MSVQRIRTDQGWMVLATFKCEPAAIRAEAELSRLPPESAFMPKSPSLGAGGPHSVQPQTDPTLPGPPIDAPETPRTAGELLAERQHAQAEGSDDEPCSSGVCLQQTEV